MASQPVVGRRRPIVGRGAQAAPPPVPASGYGMPVYGAAGAAQPYRPPAAGYSGAANYPMPGNTYPTAGNGVGQRPGATTSPATAMSDPRMMPSPPGGGGPYGGIMAGQGPTPAEMNGGAPGDPRRPRVPGTPTAGGPYGGIMAGQNMNRPQPALAYNAMLARR